MCRFKLSFQTYIKIEEPLLSDAQLLICHLAGKGHFKIKQMMLNCNCVTGCSGLNLPVPSAASDEQNGKQLLGGRLTGSSDWAV